MKDRLDTTARLRVGRALLDVVRKPWRVVPFVNTLLTVLKTGGASTITPLVPPHPTTPFETEPPASAQFERDVSDNKRLWRQVWTVQGSLAFRLGTTIVESRVSARELLRLPANMARQVAV